MVAAVRKKIGLSLSGSGHLLVYQLGACRVLRDAGLSVATVGGSSGGAIVASLMALAPEALEDYADTFIQQKGRGLTILEDLLPPAVALAGPATTELQICATRTREGTPRLFEFRQFEPRIFQCIKASCTFPQSFHPADLVSKCVTYPDGFGTVEIDGEYYCDGGISAPAPPTRQDLQRLVVSPISGAGADRISPPDSALWPSFRLKDFSVRASVSNLRALRVASGLAGSVELQEWYEKGSRDAESYLETKLD